MTKVRDIGNSKGILLPARLLADLNLRAGDEVEVTKDVDRLVITPQQKGRLSLSEAVARIDDEDDAAMMDLAER